MLFNTLGKPLAFETLWENDLERLKC